MEYDPEDKIEQKDKIPFHKRDGPKKVNQGNQETQSNPTISKSHHNNPNPLFTNSLGVYDMAKWLLPLRIRHDRQEDMTKRPGFHSPEVSNRRGTCCHHCDLYVQSLGPYRGLENRLSGVLAHPFSFWL